MRTNEMLAKLRELGVKRAHARVDYTTHTVYLRVPKRLLKPVNDGLRPLMAVAIGLEVSKLPFWKCWFDSFQIEDDMGAKPKGRKWGF